MDLKDQLKNLFPDHEPEENEVENKEKNPIPFFTNPITVTARNTPIAITAVTAMCEVVVKDIGNRPRKLDKTMNINNVIM